MIKIMRFLEKEHFNSQPSSIGNDNNGNGNDNTTSIGRGTPRQIVRTRVAAQLRVFHVAYTPVDYTQPCRVRIITNRTM